MEPNSWYEIPDELEQNLINAVDKLFKCSLSPDIDLESILLTVCDMVDLEDEFRKVIFDPIWIKKFKKRWMKSKSFRDSMTDQTFSDRQKINAKRSKLIPDSCDLRTHHQPKHQFDCSNILDEAQIFETVQNVPVLPRKSPSFNCDQELMSSPTRHESIEDDDITFSKQVNFAKLLNGELNLDSICLSCGTTEEIVAKHPLFVGGLCSDHKALFHENFFKYDADGYHTSCSVCCMGMKVVLCDVRDCGRCYCESCLDYLVGKNSFRNAVSSNNWICFFCEPSNDSLLIKRKEWQEEIQRLYQTTENSEFPAFIVPQPTPVATRKPIRVLSLFDGIATGMVALKQLGLEIGKFVASEIDDDAIRLVQNKHPEVVHVGDITKLTDDDIFSMGPFDLLLGGSPCNDLSGANPKRRGLIDAEGSGCLFFDFYRVLKTIEPPRELNSEGQPQRPFFWLFENVVSMKGIEKQRISRFLQCEPRMADARCVSAAARPRLFWGNLPGLKDRKISPGMNGRLTVQDCLESGRKATVEKLNTITTKFTCLYQGQTRQAPVIHNGKEDILWTTEVEHVFGVPEHYTDVNNLGPRERLALLGRSWSVPVVRILLSPLKEYFAGAEPELLEGKESWRK